MTRARTIFRCNDCGGTAPKWVGRCPSCDAWNTLVEEHDEGRVDTLPVDERSAAQRIADVPVDEFAPVHTGVAEFDRVLHGGLVPGSVTLIGGEPGIGKSTLLLQVLWWLADAGARCLYVTGEESPQQVRLRAERLGTLSRRLWLVGETALPHVLAHVDELEPDVLAVDSIQTLYDPALSSAPGSVAQVREGAHRLVREAKRRAMSTVLVGHVTKDGALAGPRVLEHVVDTVLSFEGERHHALRLLRASKHRFGGTNELGLFEMTPTGLTGVPDASAMFLADRRVGVPGSIVAPVLDGQRPLLVEVQALVSVAGDYAPKRSAHGIDASRFNLLTAVLDELSGVTVRRHDVHAAVAGGVRATEPGVDLAVALAIVSSITKTPLPPDLVACGEIGLGGEIRQVAQTQRRLAEAARLGFTRAVVPESAPPAPDGIELVRVASLVQAIDEVVGATRAGRPRPGGGLRPVD